MDDLFAPVPPDQVVPASPARFQATVSWTDSNGNARDGNLTVISTQTKGFWFFEPDNIDLVVKVLDGRSVNGKFWVFYAPLTNQAFTLTVTDTLTGAVRTYTNAAGQMQSGSDTKAF